MKKVLVTGAGGYIGRHVVKTLIDIGADVIATDVYVDNIDKRATIIKTDIFSENKDIFRALGEPDACLHMAWKDGFIHNSNSHMECLSSHYEFIKNIVNGGLKQIAIMGTMHEVGYFEGAIDENTLTNPTSMYGIAKDSLRKSIDVLFKDRDVVSQWLRCYYIYGDDKRSNSIFGKIIRAEEEGKKEFPFTTGKNKYDFITVDELSKQLSYCVMQDKIEGIINCCSGKPISLAEQTETFIKESNFNIRLKYGAFPDRPYDSPGVWGNSDKIEAIIKQFEVEREVAYTR